MYVYLSVNTCIFISNYVYGICEHVYSAPRGQKKASAPLELELQAVLSCPKKMFGIKHGSYGKAMYVLN